ARFDRQRIGLAWFDQRALCRPQKRQLRAHLIESDAKTVGAEVEEGKLLLLDEASNQIQHFREELELEMKNFHEPAGAPLPTQEEMRAALLHLGRILQAAVNPIEGELPLAVVNSLPRFAA